MKVIKNVMALCVAAVLALNVSRASAGEAEDAMAKAFATAYAKEQLKHQLAQFLNQNPQVVFSASSAIGTQSMHFLSQAMGAYGLLTARSDKERMWSATYLILSPEPTTALILFAAQMADTLITMKHQRDLARRYEKIAEIQAQTVKVMMGLAQQDINSQLALLSRFEKAIKQIENLEKALLTDKVYLVLKADAGTVPALAASSDIETSLGRLTQLDSALLELEITSLYLEKTIDAERFGLGQTFIQECVLANRSFDVLREKMEGLKASFFYFFASLDARALKAQIRKDLQPYSTEIRVYQRCVQILNAAETDAFFHMPVNAPFGATDDRRSEESGDELASCVARFNLKGNKK